MTGQIQTFWLTHIAPFLAVFAAALNGTTTNGINGNSEARWMTRGLIYGLFTLLLLVAGAYLQSSISALHGRADVARKRVDQIEERLNARSDRFAAIEARQAAAEVRDAAVASVIADMRASIESLRIELRDHDRSSRERRRLQDN